MQSLEEAVNYKIIRERNKELKALENDAALLAEIMQDLSFMLHQQSEQLDAASAQVEIANENIVISERHLHNAQLQSTNLKSKLWTGAAVCAGLAIGGIGIAFVVPVAGAITAGLAFSGAATFVGLAVRKN